MNHWKIRFIGLIGVIILMFVCQTAKATHQDTVIIKPGPSICQTRCGYTGCTTVCM